MANAECEAAQLGRVERAYAFRDGLLIALWANRPLRIANLANVELDRSLIRLGSARRLVFHDSEMKGDRPFSCVWPEKLEPALRIYLDLYRPVLLSRRRETAPSKALWISQFGKSMTTNSVGQIIRLRTEAHFGEPLNPHLMRYLTSTSYAEQEPEMIADVAAMLHHTDLETSEKHYILANSMKAIAKFQDVVVSSSRSRKRATT